MSVIRQRGTVTPTSAPTAPRLVLAAPQRLGVLDGGWWPRSWDPVAELPGLILALTERHGRIRHIMLNIHAWDSRFRRLAVGPDVVRLGWFDTLDPAVLVATTGGDLQVDLLIVPPSTAAAAAERAMAAAADPANVRRAPDILAAIRMPPAPAATTRADPCAVWDNEGGGDGVAARGRDSRADARRG
ncbi:hypothetical protein GCM10010169_04660 [Micromonospora fulviviridis]|uniref:DUF5994 family protein n=1 Tax=Micromonospora fulviviridis TaxID=47860 RepID=UPI00166CB29E|nr:DUF5994 family protein [Micromonospora fulviviridis]GGR64681.1 hypothetical protein GCM10010169_04660 [Micromonospora fulviviridis]